MNKPMRKLTPDDLVLFALMQFYEVGNPHFSLKPKLTDMVNAVISALRNGNPSFGEMDQAYDLIPVNHSG